MTTPVALTPGREAEFLDRAARDDCDDARRLGDLDLDEGERAVHGDGLHDAGEAVAGAGRARPCRAEPLDLGRRHDAAVRTIALRPDPAGAVPAPQRVEADPQRPRGLARREQPAGHQPQYGASNSVARSTSTAVGEARGPRPARVEKRLRCVAWLAPILLASARSDPSWREVASVM